MKAHVAEALEESIEHWKRMRDAETLTDLGNESPYGEHCPLCQSVKNGNGFADCKQCQVYARTRKLDCGGTPWRRAADAFTGWRYRSVAREAWQAAADEEIAFLESLREQS